jgi:hypothetical protein
MILVRTDHPYLRVGCRTLSPRAPHLGGNNDGLSEDLSAGGILPLVLPSHIPVPVLILLYGLSRLWNPCRHGLVHLCHASRSPHHAPLARPVLTVAESFGSSTCCGTSGSPPAPPLRAAAPHLWISSWTNVVHSACHGPLALWFVQQQRLPLTTGASPGLLLPHQYLQPGPPDPRWNPPSSLLRFSFPFTKKFVRFSVLLCL